MKVGISKKDGWMIKRSMFLPLKFVLLENKKKDLPSEIQIATSERLYKLESGGENICCPAGFSTVTFLKKHSC